ncbi:MAG: hypothetical protein OXI55_04970 [Gammaproteobacteria bacterium]|nr:hypothetical protein [Gammaproteobacteria bacterium]
MAQATGRHVRRIAATAWVAVVLCGMVGAWTLRNDRDPLGRQDRNPQGWAAAYERAFGHLADLPQPRPSRVELALDVFPEEQRLRSRGSVVVRNETPVNIPELHLTAPRRSTSITFRVPGEIIAVQEHLPLYSYRLRRPLEPGETLLLRFQLEVDLAHTGADRLALHPSDFLPHIGYDRGLELDNARARRRQNLPLVHRRRADTPRLGHLRATVSTAAQHVAVAPGTLTRHWREDGRAFYEYLATDAGPLADISIRSTRQGTPRLKPPKLAEGTLRTP